MIKKLLGAILLSWCFFAQPALAQEVPTEASSEYIGHVYFFHSESCPHCKEEMDFLLELSKQEQYLDIQFLEFEISQNDENRELLRQVGELLDQDTSGVPFTVIGSEVIIGYLNEETTGEAIVRAIDTMIEQSDIDIVGSLLSGEDIDLTSVQYQSGEQEAAVPETIHLPLFGDIDTANASLPILSIMLGFIDGFNPCAMWVLVFLISIMMGMENKKRMWTLGTTFIIISGVVYYVFMAAWLNVLMFIGFLFAVRLIIGLVAIGGGAYSIHDFYTNKDAECKVGDLDQKQKTMAKMRKVVKKPSFLAAFFGIIVLAIGVNFIELVCSAGIPAVFTQVLNMSGISTLARYAYMGLYVLLYMIDDIAVFVIAMLTLQVTGVTAKYTRATRLIGGIIMLIIGLLMIIRPELLTFA